jgi:hypothetical protein
VADAAREIENLLYTYAERIDAGDFEGLADLFLHGRILPTPDAKLEHAIVGRDRVLALYRATTRLYPDGTPHTHHVTSNAIVEVDEAAGTAAARSRFTVLQELEGFPLQAIVAGRYRDTFKRIGGRWWFDARTMLVDHVGDVSRHLLIQLKG